MKSFSPCVIGLRGIGDLDGERPLLGLAVGQADVRENAAEHLFPGGQPVLGGVIGAVNRDVAVSGANELEDRLLLAGVNLNSSSRRSAVTMSRSYLLHGRRFQDGGVFADRDLEPAGVFERAGKVQCLIAVSVMLALAARKQQDLGAVGHLLLGQGRVRRATRQDHAQDDDSWSTHGRCSCLGEALRVGSIRRRSVRRRDRNRA